MHYLVFSLERLVRHLCTKTCKHLVHSSLFEAKKTFFFKFFSIFLNLLFIVINYFCFPLPRAPGVSNQHKNLHTPCGHDYLRSHKISYFFEFFAIFSGWSKYVDRTATSRKGVSISDTNGGGAKLSIPKN